MIIQRSDQNSLNNDTFHESIPFYCNHMGIIFAEMSSWTDLKYRDADSIVYQSWDLYYKYFLILEVFEENAY